MEGEREGERERERGEERGGGRDFSAPYFASTAKSIDVG